MNDKLAADKGMSHAQIRTMGRWKSNAFLKYIRLQSKCQNVTMSK